MSLGSLDFALAVASHNFDFVHSSELVNFAEFNVVEPAINQMSFSVVDKAICVLTSASKRYHRICKCSALMP